MSVAPGKPFMYDYKYYSINLGNDAAWQGKKNIL